MAILKCKMCGGELNITEGLTVAECEYCGSVQTVPTADNEKKLTLFARANRLRAGCEFDKAAGIYETIVADFPEEAEAYWGLVLCKYGIEYVDDPATGRKIPTCHRSSFNSVLEDSDFEQALENADVMARKVYREEARQIEEIRKGIIAVSANEQPYDIFICYKETAENGERTLDSVLAQDIYDALTDKGYRVFFSRITLEDKLGMEYEPYIFSALNSAKVMLAVGTDYEYYNAVWVKNEWSRYLKLMEQDKSKHLIPCFKGIDAYDMPKEFARLQAQDMGKVGAMQDLLRGVEKLMGKTETDTVTAAVTAPTANPMVDSLLRRVFIFLEDGEWKSADEYCEKVLDIEPENAQAYLGKLMAELHVRTQEDLKDEKEPFDNNSNYKKAIRFADGALKEDLVGIISSMEERENEKIYENAIMMFNEEKYFSAMRLFKKIANYKDSKEFLDKSICAVDAALVQQIAAVKVNEKWGYIDETGKMVIKPQFDEARSFSENGLAPVELNGKWGYIDETGEMVIAPQFDVADSFSENGLAVVKVNGKWGYIDETGEMVIAPQFDVADGFSENGLARVKVNGNWGFINETGEVVIAPQFDATENFSENGLAMVEVNSKWGYIDETGEVVIAPQFDDTYEFSENGLAMVEVNGKFGYIDETGKTVIVPQFDDAEDFSENGLAQVEINDKYGYIDKTGEVVIAPRFDDAHEFSIMPTKENVAQKQKRAEAIAERKKRVEEKRRAKEREAAERERQEAAAQARREQIAAEQKRREEQRRAEEKRREEERRAAERAAVVAKLRQEQSALQTELASLKGLFTGRRRREIEARLVEIERKLNDLYAQEK